MFFIAKRKNANQDVFYFSAKIPPGVPFLIELTTVIGNPGVKCAIKTPNPDIASLFFEAIETLLRAWLCLLKFFLVYVNSILVTKFLGGHSAVSIF